MAATHVVCGRLFHSAGESGGVRARSPAAIYTYSRTTDDLRLQASSRCPRRLERGASLLADAFTSSALASRRPRSVFQDPVVSCLRLPPFPRLPRQLPTCRVTSRISRIFNDAPTPRRTTSWTAPKSTLRAGSPSGSSFTWPSSPAATSGRSSTLSPPSPLLTRASSTATTPARTVAPTRR